MIDLATLRAELARRSMNQTQLAVALGVPPTTLSGWLRGLYESPDDLVIRIEAALALPAGALSSVGKPISNETP